MGIGLGSTRYGEVRFIVLAALVFCSLSFSPYLYGYLSCPRDQKFVGLVGWDVPGTYMYFMWEKQAEKGQILFEDRLTPERHDPFYFNLEWLLLGRALGISHLSLVAGFQVERCLTILVSFFIIYFFVGTFFKDNAARRGVFLWIILTSGFGWIFWVVKEIGGYSWAIRIWDIEGVNLFGYLINKPHVIRSLALICLSYTFLIKGEEKNNIVYFLLAGITIAIQGFIRPYDLPTAFLLLAIFPVLVSVREGSVVRSRTRNYLTSFVIALPILIYYLFLRSFILEDVFKGVSFEAFTPLEMIIWIGLPAVLAFYSYDGLKNWRHWNDSKMFLYVWTFIVFTLIYAYPIIPWGMESAGLCYIIAPILAGYVLFDNLIPALMGTGWGGIISARFNLTRRKWSVWVTMVVILLCVPSNIVLLGKMFETLSAHTRPYYIPVEVAEGFSWLNAHGSSEDVVLSDMGNGFHLPVDASVKAFIGHGHFTVDFAGKSNLLHRFFSDKESDAFRKELLEHYDVKYVFYSDLERRLGSFNPSTASYLQPAYRNSLVTIYKVLSG